MISVSVPFFAMLVLTCISALHFDTDVQEKVCTCAVVRTIKTSKIFEVLKSYMISHFVEMFNTQWASKIHLSKTWSIIKVLSWLSISITNIGYIIQRGIGNLYNIGCMGKICLSKV